MDEYEAYNLIVNGVKSVKTIKNKKKITKTIKKVTNIRKEHGIKCHSKTSAVPEPIESFSDLVSLYNVNTDFLKCFESIKYTRPTPVQMQTIPAMIEGHNVITLAPTGSGKTAAFLIPVLHDVMSITKTITNTCSPKAVILSPTIELAKQTYQECICLVKEIKDESKPSIVFCCKENNNSAHWREIMNKADILVCTPARFKKIINRKDEYVVSTAGLKWLIVDESDRMLEESINSFSDQLKNIYEVCMKAENLHVAMFSATQNAAVWTWANENLSKDLIYVKVGNVGAAVETISQQLRYCCNELSKLMDIKSLLVAGKLKCPCLIFLDKADSAFQLHKLLEQHGRNFQIKLAMISGELSDSKRRDVITEFREGKIHFLICTNLLARGMDFKGVETVLNYDLPKQKEEYIHRIGRCGRAGREGSAISLWTDDDVVNGLSDIMKIMKASGQPVNEELFELVKKKSKSNNYKGDKLLKKLKRKYATDDSIKKPMTSTDKKRKMYFEKCVIRKKDLQKKYMLMSVDE